jgi:hypothetical protein
MPIDPPGQPKPAVQKSDEMEAESSGRRKDSSKIRFLGWLLPERSGRRAFCRHPLPGLVAFHWSGGLPHGYYLGNISDTGFYLLTEERPYPGTLILMTLQRTDTEGDNRGDSLAVYTKVVRWGSDGVGLAFVTPKSKDTKSGNELQKNYADQKSLKEFLKRLHLPKQE